MNQPTELHPSPIKHPFVCLTVWVGQEANRFRWVFCFGSRKAASKFSGLHFLLEAGLGKNLLHWFNGGFLDNSMLSWGWHSNTLLCLHICWLEARPKYLNSQPEELTGVWIPEEGQPHEATWWLSITVLGDETYPVTLTSEDESLWVENRKSQYQKACFWNGGMTWKGEQRRRESTRGGGESTYTSGPVLASFLLLG